MIRNVIQILTCNIQYISYMFKLQLYNIKQIMRRPLFNIDIE